MIQSWRTASVIILLFQEESSILFINFSDDYLLDILEKQY